MNTNGRTASFLRARALLILIGSLLAGSLPVFADSIQDSIKALRDPNPEIRTKAQELLIKAGPGAVEDLVAELSGPRRRAILPILARLGPKAVPRLMELLEDSNLRTRAGEALILLAGPDSAAQGPALLRCLKRDDLKHFCGQALVRVAGSGAKNLVPELAQTLKSRDEDARTYAAVALGRIGSKAQGAVAALTEALKDSVPAVRWSAAASLGQIGRKAKSALPALREALQDSDGEVRREAAQALKGISD